MDLYIQIGVLLLFLAALSLFIYIYTAPAQQFTQKINETNQKINDRLETAEGMDLAPFMNNVSTPGTSIYPLIRDSKAGKIAILVQTKNSQGLIVNYGYQLRGANYDQVTMVPNGFSGVGSAQNGGTDFEKNYVTSVDSVFGGIAAGTTGIHKFGLDAFVSSVPMNDVTAANGEMIKILNGVTQTPLSAVAGYAPSSATGNPEFQKASTPKLSFSDQTVIVDDAKRTGRSFSSTGLIYTDNVLKMDAPVNDNFSYADNQGSLYRFNQNSSYYSTIIVNANGDIVGLYVEEHGVNPAGSVLAHQMLANGTITQLY